ncbi:MAG: pilus assembly protein TadG-related protein, partial [Acidimicrobiia bacterium]
MRGLIDLARRRWESDSGATIVFAAIILVALLALTAFAVDFGRMWEERRQLQNGADAAALAIAADCAAGLCGAGYDEYAVAEVYVDANARDGRALASNVELDLAARTVTVYDATEDASGDHKFDMLFAGIVGFDGFTVGAKASVAWGNPRQLATLPIIISECEWEKYGSPAQPLRDTPISYAADRDYTTLMFHAGGNPAEDCNAVAGQDANEDGRLPGGFGWLEVENTDDCLAKVYGIDDGATPPDLGWAPSDTGNGGPPPPCEDLIEDMLLDLPDKGSTILIPYFDDLWTGPANGSGYCGNSGKCYHISGYGAFHVVGYKLASGSNMTEILFDPPVDPPLKANGQPWPSNKWTDKFDCDPDN